MVGDFVYTDAEGTELGVLPDFELDMAWGVDENDYELTLGAEPKLECGALFYQDGTEYGGIVDKWDVDETGDEVEVKYTGRTWHGILAERVICPESGADYRTYSGDANAVIGALIADYGLSAWFFAPEDAVATISGRFDRYCTLYDGLKKELHRHGLRLDVEKQVGGKVMLQAAPQGDFTSDYYSDQFDFKVEEELRHVNHLVCLGKGELKAREVVHLYADAEGNVSTTQTFTGLAERVAVYSNTNASETPEGEEEETLTELGTERLLELQEASEIDLEVEKGLGCKVGDLIAAHSTIAGASVTGTVNKMLLKIGSDGIPSISYEVGALVEESEESL